MTGCGYSSRGWDQWRSWQTHQDRFLDVFFAFSASREVHFFFRCEIISWSFPFKLGRSAVEAKGKKGRIRGGRFLTKFRKCSLVGFTLAEFDLTADPMVCGAE